MTWILKIVKSIRLENTVQYCVSPQSERERERVSKRDVSPLFFLFFSFSPRTERERKSAFRVKTVQQHEAGWWRSWSVFCVSFFFLLFARVARGMLPFSGAAWYEYGFVICQYIASTGCWVPCLRGSSWSVGQSGGRSVSRFEFGRVLLAVSLACCLFPAHPSMASTTVRVVRVPSSGVSVSGARAFLPSIGDILCPRREKYGTRKTGIRGICWVVL